MTRKRGLRQGAALLLACGWCFGAAAATTDDDAADLRQLMQVLDQQTEIATKTRLNADYVPGLVTVLHGEELVELGVRTVWEALRLVPGVEPSIDQIGGRQTLVRGVGGNFASGNMKILLNGRSMNSALTANANPVLNLPVELVDHIEVVRGPGSAVHGEFAYAGVLNVITRKQASGGFVRADEHDTYTGGAFTSWQSADGHSGGSINAGGWSARGAGVDSGRDALYNGNNAMQSALSNAPGPVNDRMEQRSLLLDLYHDALSLSFAYVEDGYGDHFGTINVLDASDARGTDYRNRYLTLGGKGQWTLAEDLRGSVSLGWQQFQNSYDIRMLPKGFVWLNSAYAPTLLPDGYTSEGFYEEQRLSADADLVWEGWTNHRLLMALGATRIDVQDAWQRNNIDPVTKNPLAVPTRYVHDDGIPWPGEDRSRRILSVTMQDEYRASEDVTVTAGVRYDDYDDFGHNTSPRLAAVWRLGRHHILKAQYAEAFRPPAFYETAFKPDLRPETIRTAELAYVFKSPDTEFRLIGFRSGLHDLIVDAGILGFDNVNDVRTRGVEMELRQRFGPRWRLEANLSLADSTQVDTGDPVAGAADRLANVVLRYEPGAHQDYALWVRHVGDRERESNDTRESLSGYQTVDLSANIGLPGVHAATVRFGVRNLFDRQIRYPAPMTLDWLGGAIPSYANDYRQPGRTGWIELSWSL
ncbi:TonB-dependent receptor [Nitrogeniibacter mangrovi]|uniref:TonB-dependent receptor n=1 Tax=Nitrogeniibacter mangrovi TaxID=2016596 RepID=A0A6C1B0F0_9RHOO|nr:TonB-dependent receptor [Nitrogeniibacter mangrovi]QID16375.1 TonB-dependent receptor [Nitrogeniibacter mangrovi]